QTRRHESRYDQPAQSAALASSSTPAPVGAEETSESHAPVGDVDALACSQLHALSGRDSDEESPSVRARSCLRPPGWLRPGLFRVSPGRNGLLLPLPKVSLVVVTTSRSFLAESKIAVVRRSDGLPFGPEVR